MAEQGIRVRLIQNQPIPLNIDLHCRPGDVLALVGPSGSGKTTILRAIAGLHHPENGSVECQGEIWQDSTRGIYLAAHQRAVGLVFQNYALFPRYCSGQCNGGHAHLPKNARKERALELFKRVHLSGLEDRYQDRYPRPATTVAVARALARSPKCCCWMSHSPPWTR
jgi:molybdate transport system ATP-binding protein